MSELITFIKNNKVVQYGEFELASGIKSGVYCDGKKITLDAQGLRYASFGLLAELIPYCPFDAIGGPSIGADPLVGGMLLASSYFEKQYSPGLKGFLVRKEPKGHGLKKFIEGPVEPGMKVVLVEDVITTGGSILQAAERCKEFGLEVVVYGAIIDRESGAEETFEFINKPYVYLSKISDFRT